MIVLLFQKEDVVLTKEQGENRIAWAEAYRFARMADALTDTGSSDDMGRCCAISVTADSYGIWQVDSESWGPLIWAHEKGDRDLVQRLLDELAAEALA